MKAPPDRTGHASTLPPGDSAYRNDQCRCDACRAGQASYVATKRAERKARGSRRADGTEPEHGNPNTYLNYGCRCRPCRDAHAAAASG